MGWAAYCMQMASIPTTYRPITRETEATVGNDEEIEEDNVLDEALPMVEEDQGQRAQLVDALVQGVDCFSQRVGPPEDSLDHFMNK
jgi:hypothetical protein